MEKPFEIFEHKADVGIRGWGETAEEALSNVLKALSTLIVEHPKFLKNPPTQSSPVEIIAEYPDELLITFINKVLSISALKNLLFYIFKGEVGLEEKRCFIKGEILGVSLDPNLYGYGVEVKGATFTLAKFSKEEGSFVAQCVVDV